MSPRYQKKIPPADLDAVIQSWKGRFIRDSLQNQLGLVHDVDTSKGIRLRARFPGEKRDRLIAIEAGQDADYVAPDDPRARYRVPTKEDIERIRQLSSK